MHQQIIFIFVRNRLMDPSDLTGPDLRGLNMHEGPDKEKNTFLSSNGQIWTDVDPVTPKGGGHNWPKWTKMKDTDWLTWPMSRPPCYLTSIVSSLSLNPVINSPDQPSDMNPIMKHASKIQIQKIQLQFLLHFSALFKWLPCSLWPRTFSHFLNSIVGFWFFISAAQHFHLW